MNTGAAAIIVALIALAGTGLTSWQNRRGADRTANLGERSQVFDELTAVKKELAMLFRRLRAATDYIDDCMADYRRRGIDPPPVRDRQPLPWEE